MRIVPEGMMASLAMMLTMAVGSGSILAIAVVAPDAAKGVGIPATAVGLFTGTVYFVGMFTGSICTIYISRFGPVRVLQVTAIFAIVGLLAFMLSTPFFALLCAILLGIAYGPINPANASVMMVVTNDQNRSFLFSVKQSGVTVGGAFSALILPPIVVLWNWEIALIAVIGLAVLSIIILQPMYPKYDRGTNLSLRLSPVSLLQPVVSVMKVGFVRGFSVVGFTYAGVQICIASYFVVFLVEQGFDLISAGTCFVFVNLGGIIGRICWGIVADKWLNPKYTLLVIGVISFVFILALFMITESTPRLILYMYALILGGTTHSWNGVYLSEIANRAPGGKAAEWTGGIQFIFYGGVAVMPPLFGIAIWLTGGFTVPTIIIAVITLVAGLYLKRLYRVTGMDQQ